MINRALKLKRKFDVVVAFEVIEHLPIGTHKRFLENVKKILKKRGDFLISTPNVLFASPNLSRPLNPFHKKEYTAEEFINLINSVFKKSKFLGLSSSDKVFNERKKGLEKNLIYRFGVYFLRFKIFNTMLSFVPWFEGVMGKPKTFKLTKKNLEKEECLLAVCR